jgi:hypothetical protein
MYTANRRTDRQTDRNSIPIHYKQATETHRQTYVTKGEGLWEQCLCACDIFAEYFKAPEKNTEIPYGAEKEIQKMTKETK